MKNVQSSTSTMASASRLIAPVGAWGIAGNPTTARDEYYRPRNRGRSPVLVIANLRCERARFS
jgi:hypothetical protein